MDFDRFATRLLYVLAWGIAAISTTQQDYWWLLRAGQEIWSSRRVELADEFSHTASGDYWPNHEWLWEVSSYVIHALGGMPLTMATVGLTAAGTLWLARLASRADGYIAPVVLALSFPLLSVAWTPRPQVTTMLLLALTTLLIVRERFRWLPLVFLAWSNLHAQVAIGGLILAVVWVLAVAEVRTQHGNTTRARELTLATLGSGVATLLTPLGPRLWTYVLQANGRPGQDRIAEWDSAFHPLISNGIFWALLVVGVSLAWRRRARLAEWSVRAAVVSMLVMGLLGALAVRNIPCFMVVAIPVLMSLGAGRPPRAVGTVKRGGIAVCVWAACVLVAVGAVWVAAPRSLGWNPLSSALTSALRGCPGNLYNTYNDGAAVIWFAPSVPVFVDNRQDPYDADVIEAGSSLDAALYEKVFSRYEIGCALSTPGTALSKALAMSGWHRIYEDSSYVLFYEP